MQVITPNPTGLSRLMSSLSSVLRRGEPSGAGNISSTRQADHTGKKKAAAHLDREIVLCFHEILNIHDDIKRAIPETTLSNIKTGDGKGNLISHLKDALSKFVESFGSLGCDAHTGGADRRSVSHSPQLKQQNKNAGSTSQQQDVKAPDVRNGLAKCEQGINKLNDLVARLNDKINELRDDDPGKAALLDARDSAVGLLHQFQALLAVLSASVSQQMPHHAGEDHEAMVAHLPRQDGLTA